MCRRRDLAPVRESCCDSYLVCHPFQVPSLRAPMPYQPSRIPGSHMPLNQRDALLQLRDTNHPAYPNVHHTSQGHFNELRQLGEHEGSVTHTGWENSMYWREGEYNFMHTNKHTHTHSVRRGCFPPLGQPTQCLGEYLLVVINIV